jgi:hypothetical protein
MFSDENPHACSIMWWHDLNNIFEFSCHICIKDVF